ncbi:hypothetical protein JXM83_00050 [Candidatus Woesearchaeota archaeon]|nr:hypothetical protein [Candidatus Woesearchaeota archaeon]
MKFRKNKNASSHVGIVISFTLFVTGIIFMYNIVGSPIKSVEEKSDNLDFIKINFLNYVNEEIVILRFPPLTQCITFSNPDFDFPNPMIYSTDGIEIGSSISGGSSIIDLSNNLTKVYFSNSSFDKNIEAIGTGCILQNPSSVSYEKISTEKKINEIIDLSINDETYFMNLLGITSDYDYSIIFEFSDGRIIGEDKTLNRNIKSNIYSKEYIINYLSVDGLNVVGKLKLKVW